MDSVEPIPTCRALISGAPFASVKTKVKSCADPIPLFGETETATGITAALATVKNAVALWTRDPLTPVTVAVTVPTVAREVVVSVKVLDPDPVILAGLKLAVAPEASPAAESVTVPAVAPEVVDTVIVVDPDPVKVVGLKLALAPVPRPDAAKVTVPLNPLSPVSVTV